MKNLNKVAMLFATVALATAAGAQSVDNWKSGAGDAVWKNGTNTNRKKYYNIIKNGKNNK